MHWIETPAIIFTFLLTKPNTNVGALGMRGHLLHHTPHPTPFFFFLFLVTHLFVRSEVKPFFFFGGGGGEEGACQLPAPFCPSPIHKALPPASPTHFWNPDATTA